MNKRKAPITSECDSDCRCSQEPPAGLDRRDFVKVGGLAASGAALGQLPMMAAPMSRSEAIGHFVPADKELSSEWVKSLFDRGERKVYRGAELTTIGMPCGGICAGQLYVRGDGTLAQWWIANNAHNTGIWWVPIEDPDKKYEFDTPLGKHESGYRTYRPPGYIAQGFAVAVNAPGEPPQVHTLDQDGFDDISFVGEYPIATIDYRSTTQPALPIEIRSEVYSPFIPLNTRDSALPATILRYTVKNTSEKAVDVSLAGWLENMVGVGIREPGTILRRNRVVRQAGMTSVRLDAVADPAGHKHYTDTPPPQKASFSWDHPQAGNMALTILDGSTEATADWVSREVLLEGLKGGAPPRLAAAREFPLNETACAALKSSFPLQPGQERTLTFVLSWYFPHRHQGQQQWSPWGEPVGDHTYVGNQYANWFDGCLDVARYLKENLGRLDRETRLFRDTCFDTTLPYWFMHRIAMPISTLATETCQWWKNGRFYGWEGVGCCPGTCGHVWHYDQAVGRLFPELERSVREMQDFQPGVGFLPETGAISFRGRGWELWAGDSQAGCILMAYREHQFSVDDRFLRSNWPRIRKALEFLIQEDGNQDGMIEGSQHNTYDINFYGANTLTGSLYHAALLAGEQMARLMDEAAFARLCRRIFEEGRSGTVKRLFNGEYFIQEVDLEEHPRFQYKDGCLSDQLLGQTWAHQLGLGYLYSPQAVRKSLQSVWKYNWAPDIGPQVSGRSPEINFAFPGEAGLLLCTWPKGKHMEKAGVRYRDTVWTGIEFQVAAHMIYEGLLTEGLAIIRGIHERYDGVKHNPWNHVLCGDHYSRAMASWGCLLTISGYTQDGPAGKIGFAPRLTPESFKCLFTAAEGWGSLLQKRQPGLQVNTIDLKWGRLRLRSLGLELPAEAKLNRALVDVNGRQVAAQAKQEGSQVTLTLADEATSVAGQAIQARLSW